MGLKRIELIVTKRFLAFFPQKDHCRTIIEFKKRMETNHNKLPEFSIINDQNYLFSCETNHIRHSVIFQEELNVLDVFQGTKISNKTFDTLSVSDTWDEFHKAADSCTQVYNIIRLSCKSFRLESDPLGIKPIYRTVVAGGNVVVASNLYDLLSLYPELNQPVDPVGFYGLMEMSFPIGDHTLHKKIKRTKTGESYTWSLKEGFSVSRRRRIEVPFIDKSIGFVKASENILNHLKTSLKNRTSTSHYPINIALSGGYDSRLLLAIARELSLPMEAFTYGANFHKEVYTAKFIAKILKIPHQIIPYPTNNLINRLNLHLDSAEGQVDLGTIQIANMIDSNINSGTSLMIGFLGDAIGGDHLNWVDESRMDNFNSLAAAIVDGFSKPKGFKKLSLPGIRFSKEEVLNEVKKDLLQDVDPHQALMIWDLENRQRRFIGSHFQILGTKFDVIAPYYDIKLIKSWLTIPYIALLERNMFFRIIGKNYPEISKIPHPESGHLITPNLKNQLLFWLRDKRYKFLSHLPGLSLYDGNIDNLWTTLSTQQKEYMWKCLIELQNYLSNVLGIQVTEDNQFIVKESPQFTRNLFMIANYCKYIQTQLIENKAT